MTQTRAIGSICEQVYEQVRSDALRPEEWYVGLAELPGGGSPAAEPVTLASAAAGKSAKMRFERGDVLFGRLRPYLNKVWLADRDGVCSPELLVLRCFDPRDAPDLAWLLRAPQVLDRIVPLQRGANLPRVAWGDLADVRVEFAELPARRRLREALEAVVAIERLRAAAIAETEALLAAVFAERFGDPAANDRGWPLTTLGERIARAESGWSPRCHNRAPEAGEWGVIRLGAISSGWFLPGEAKALPADVEPRPQLGLRTGDLLISRANTRELVGAVALVDDDHPQLMLPDTAWRLEPAGGWSTQFLAGVLAHAGMRQATGAIAHGANPSMVKLAKGRLAELPVIDPDADAIAAYDEAARAIRLRHGEQRRQAEQLAALRTSLLVHGLGEGTVAAAPLAEAPGETDLADAALDDEAVAGLLPLEPAAEPVLRPIFFHLSELQRSVWTAVLAADGGESLTLADVRRAVGGDAIGRDDALRALEVLVALGVLIRDGRADHEAWRRPLAGVDEPPLAEAG